SGLDHSRTVPWTDACVGLAPVSGRNCRPFVRAPQLYSAPWRGAADRDRVRPIPGRAHPSGVPDFRLYCVAGDGPIPAGPEPAGGPRMILERRDFLKLAGSVAVGLASSRCTIGRPLARLLESRIALPEPFRLPLAIPRTLPVSEDARGAGVAEIRVRPAK